MSMRYGMMWLLLGLVVHGPAMALDVSRWVDKHTRATPTKISSQIRQAMAMVQSHRVLGSAPDVMRGVDGRQIAVYIYHQCLDEEPLLASSTMGITYAKLDYRVLEEVAALDCVNRISYPVYAYARVGSVTSAGDMAMRTEELRAVFGVDGSNVRIGIISDSLINLPASVNTGDLPPDLVIVNGQDGSGVPGTIEEGRAMAELIHDLAPGATLLFHRGVPTSLEMITAIRALTAAGAHIIVDDLGFFLEPFFEDGPVAQAVQEAIASGVLYVTAVGNEAEANYYGMFQELDPNDDDPQNNVHDFGGGDGTLGVTLPPGATMQVVLQWPNPYDGSANTADYDLFVLNADGTDTACSTPGIAGLCISDDAQLLSPLSPVETIFVRNDTDQSVSLDLVINRFAGEVLPLRMVFGGHLFLDEHNVLGHSVFGHPCVREALAVGAINASDPGFDTIESFSSRGPCEIFFVPAAAGTMNRNGGDAFRTAQVLPLTPPELRDKPDVVAADGTNTSLPSFTPFFGTSAAAPHAAAAAALLMDLGGGPDVVGASLMMSLIRMAAVDRGAPGVDEVYGFGVIDVVQAADVLLDVPQATILAPTADVVVTAGSTISFLGMCGDVNNHGPFTFAWDFGGGGGVAGSSEQNPSVTFPQPGTFTVTLTCSNVIGLPSVATSIGVVVNTADDNGGTNANTGGGCTLVADVANRPPGALGSMCLPILTLCSLWAWRRWRA